MVSYGFRDARREDSPAVCRLVESVLTEYGLQPDPGSTDADLADLEATYRARGGVFRLAESSAGSLVGCGGLFPLDSQTVELRKMYLLPEARGCGLGKRMLTDLLGEARRLEYRKVVLETNSVLEEAISLYRSFGFQPVEREHLAERCDQGWELRLVGEKTAVTLG